MPSRIYDAAFFEGYLVLASQDEGVVILDIAYQILRHTSKVQT